jgi:hypothetical protein
VPWLKASGCRLRGGVGQVEESGRGEGQQQKGERHVRQQHIR